MDIFSAYTSDTDEDYNSAQGLKPADAYEKAEKAHSISDTILDEIQNCIRSEKSLSLATRCGFFAMLRTVRRRQSMMIGAIKGLYKNYDNICAQNNRLLDEIESLQTQLSYSKKSGK